MGGDTLAERPQRPAPPPLESQRVSLPTLCRRRPLQHHVAALGCAATAEAAFWIVLVIHAYARGGALETSLVVISHLAAASVIVPRIARLAGALPPRALLAASHGTQAVTVALLGWLIASGADGLLVYTASAIAACALSLTSPMSSALAPGLADDPGELGPINAVRVLTECGGDFLGALVAAIAMDLMGAAVATYACAALCVLAAAAGLRSASHPPRARVPVAAEPKAPRPGRRPEPGERLLVLGVAIPTVLCGLLEVATPALASRHAGEDGADAGYLAACLGIGAMAGAVSALARRTRKPQLPAFSASLIVALLATLGMGLATDRTELIALLLLCGAANGHAWVLGTTLIQNAAPDGRQLDLFGIVEGFETACLGAVVLAVGVLSSGVGIGGCLAVVGLVGAAVVPWLHQRLAGIEPAAAPRLG